MSIALPRWITKSGQEPEVHAILHLEATTLYEYLGERYPGHYESTLRTVQRRVQAWKAAHGVPQEVMFELHHAPGMVGHSDFTEVKQVSITIGGQPFEHLLYHYRLAYSGWQYVQVIQGGVRVLWPSQKACRMPYTLAGEPRSNTGLIA